MRQFTDHIIAEKRQKMIEDRIVMFNILKFTATITLFIITAQLIGGSL